MCPEHAPARPVNPGARLLCLLVLFVAGFLLFSQSFFHWYTDERRYTNAAIIMVRPGDYASPRMFGIHLWADRLPFILAGALVIALTYRTARALTGDPETAWRAAAIRERALVAGSIAAITAFLVAGMSEHNFGDSEVVMLAWMIMALPFTVRGARTGGKPETP